MENKNVVYLARVFGKRSAENFEDFLNGKDVQLGSERKDAIITESVQSVDISKAESVVQRVKWEDNAKKTAEVNSYFFVGESVEEVATNIQILNSQPTDEMAYQKIENNKDLNRFDLLGNGKVSMCVIKVDGAFLEELITQGYGEKRVGTYGTDLDKLTIPEVVLGDEGFKKVLTDKDNAEVVVYDEIHNAMESVGVEYDSENIFENDYSPEVTIDNTKDEQQNEARTERTNEDVVKNEISDARKQIDEMFNSGLISQDDYDLMLSALGEVPTGDTSFDDEMGE